MIKAIILDFDGVVVDSEKNKFCVLQTILKNRGLDLKKPDFTGMTGKKTKSLLVEKFPELTSQDVRKIVELRREMQKASPNPGLIPGIKTLLKFLKQKKVKIALTTGSKGDVVEKILESEGLRIYFDLIVTGEDFKGSKPSPECYNTTLKKLRLSNSEALAIEDSMAGIESAHLAGIGVYALTTYSTKAELSNAEAVFKDHKGVLAHLRKKHLFG